MVEFILGGARSGKSRLAEQRALHSGLDVIYVATATGDDAEMAARIRHHQQSRPAHWPLIEEPLLLAEVVERHASPQCCLLIDCLTLWLSNQLFNSDGNDDDDSWPLARQAFLDSLASASGPVILVSNEVGQGIVPLGELSRRFVDEAGRLHQDVAALASRVQWVVAGLSQVLKDVERQGHA